MRAYPVALFAAFVLLGCSSDGAGANTPPSGGPPPSGGDVQCTMDAKICPDGSSVGRTGPNCEFAPCPQGLPSVPAAPGSAPTGEPSAGCKNECGNGTCQEMVCQAVGCPCSESKQSCPQDCK